MMVGTVGLATIGLGICLLLLGLKSHLMLRGSREPVSTDGLYLSMRKWFSLVGLFFVGVGAVVLIVGAVFR